MPSSQHARARLHPVRVLLALMLALGLLTPPAAASAAGSAGADRTPSALARRQVRCTTVEFDWHIYRTEGAWVAWTKGHITTCTNGRRITGSSATGEGDSVKPGYNYSAGDPYKVSFASGSWGTYGHTSWQYDGTIKDYCLGGICGQTVGHFHLRMTTRMYPALIVRCKGCYRWDGRTWRTWSHIWGDGDLMFKAPRSAPALGRRSEHATARP